LHAAGKILVLLVLKDLFASDLDPQNLEPKEFRSKIFGNNNLDSDFSRFGKARRGLLPAPLKDGSSMLPF
jgi:hypothetical protein